LSPISALSNGKRRAHQQKPGTRNKKFMLHRLPGKRQIPGKKQSSVWLDAELNRKAV
jgi:hypothetical protein